MHLIKTLKEHHGVEEDWKRKQYLGTAVDWDYKNREVHKPMPDSVEWALAQFGHSIPRTPQHQPHQHAIATYGVTVLYAKPEDTSKSSHPPRKYSSKN
jgi:hypothetical protein